MSRQIVLSTDVYAAIWAARRVGEETEDAILRRLLGCKPAKGNAVAAVNGVTGSGGVRDVRNGVDFPEGFEIFRHYKSREFKAVASSGHWLRNDNGERYPTLNQLNASIAAGAENVWNGNWKFKDTDGTIKSIGTLR
jgi:hypothetical protein